MSLLLETERRYRHFIVNDSQRERKELLGRRIEVQKVDGDRERYGDREDCWYFD